MPTEPDDIAEFKKSVFFSRFKQYIAFFVQQSVEANYTLEWINHQFDWNDFIVQEILGRVTHDNEEDLESLIDRFTLDPKSHPKYTDDDLYLFVGFLFLNFEEDDLLELQEEGVSRLSNLQYIGYGGVCTMFSEFIDDVIEGFQDEYVRELLSNF